MNRSYLHMVFCLMVFSTLQGQKNSRADQLYFEYSYRQAIEAYRNEMRKSPLSPAQQLNLADSYFRTGQYREAAEVFMEVYRKDSLMTNSQFNTMLQALSRTSGQERARAFLNTRSDQVSDALLQNAEFNYQTLDDPAADNANYRIYSPNFNSRQSDFSPSFYGPDRLLFASGRPASSKPDYGPASESYLSIFSVSPSAKGSGPAPAPFGKVPPTEYHQATPFYSDALQQVFYVQSNEEDGDLIFNADGKNALGICRAGLDGSFEFLFRDFSTSFYYPFYDEATGRLYFAADFDKGYGGTDLYYVYSNNGQIMSEPVNLGPHINTPGNEIAPYIFEGSLYFSSDVFYGLGGMDIYKSELQGGDSYSIPVNLGPGINSDRDDFGFIIRKAGEGGYEGYFASNRPGGLGMDDIYGFTSDKKPGLRTLAFRGIIREPGGLGIEKAYIKLFQGDTLLIKESYSGEEGGFRLEIPWQEDVRVVVGKQKYETLDLGNTASDPSLGSGEPRQLTLTPLESVVVRQGSQTLMKVDDFHFARNSKNLTPEITGALDEVAAELIKFPKLRLRLEAHTDSRGYARTNLTLSEGRAAAIRDYLVGKGVAPEVFAEVKGYGESQIINSCTDGVYCLEMLHQQNERYPIVVLNYEEL